jgi:hypothetical protein
MHKRQCEAARWLTNAICNHLDEHVPMDAKNTVSSVSLRIVGITEMAASNVDFWASHAKSRHSLPTHQERY